SSGDPDTEWSEWTTRFFATGPSSSVYPLEVIDAADSPPPGLRDVSGSPLTVPPSSSIALLSEAGETLLAFDAQRTTTPPPLRARRQRAAVHHAGARGRHAVAPLRQRICRGARGLRPSIAGQHRVRTASPVRRGRAAVLHHGALRNDSRGPARRHDARLCDG